MARTHSGQYKLGWDNKRRRWRKVYQRKQKTWTARPDETKHESYQRVKPLADEWMREIDGLAAEPHRRQWESLLVAIRGLKDMARQEDARLTWQRLHMWENAALWAIETQQPYQVGVTLDFAQWPDGRSVELYGPSLSRHYRFADGWYRIPQDGERYDPDEHGRILWSKEGRSWDENAPLTPATPEQVDTVFNSIRERDERDHTKVRYMNQIDAVDHVRSGTSAKVSVHFDKTEADGTVLGLTYADDFWKEMAIQGDQRVALEDPLGIPSGALGPPPWELEQQSQQSLAKSKDQFLSSLTARSTRERIITVDGRVDQFLEFMGEGSLPSAVTEARLLEFGNHVNAKVVNGEWKHATAKAALQVMKQFVRFLYRQKIIDALPRNLDDLQPARDDAETGPKSLPLESIKQLLKVAEGRNRLFMLLGLNCGFRQSDISDIRQHSVDLKAATLTYKRKKTRKHSSVPTVCYPLWPETVELLREFQSDDKTFWIVNQNGNPLRSLNDRNSASDAIKNAWHRMQKTDDGYLLGEKPVSFGKLRATSSTQLRTKFGLQLVRHWLGQAGETIAEKHYIDIQRQQMEEAMKWLRLRLGV